jgi:large subunit ribosomal protein L24
MKIKKNDQVLVISGRDKGKKGRVLSVNPDKQRVLVEGVGMIKRHTKPNPQKNIKGGIVEREATIHASNVMLIDPDTSAPTRVGFKIQDDGTKLRISRKSGAVVDR